MRAGESDEVRARTGAMLVKATKLREKCMCSMPRRAAEALQRIDDSMHCSTPLVMFSLISDLSYFIGYMESMNDLKRG